MSDSLETENPKNVALIITTSQEKYNKSLVRRFAKSVSVSELKETLEAVTGANAESMTIELYDKEDRLLSTLDNDTAPLDSYNVDNGMRLHVVDDFAQRKKSETSPEFERYQMTAEEYEKRFNSLRSYLKRNKLGKYNETEIAARKEAQREELKRDKELAGKCNVGDRCEVAIPGEPVRRGTIKYVGEVENRKSSWIGVQYDGPFGKHNGTIDGKTYFECPNDYGEMVRPIHVKPGDFPVTPPNHQG